MFDEAEAAAVLEGIRAYVSKVTRLDRDDLLDDILASVVAKMRLPNAIFEKKDFSIGEEDEQQERYLSFREDLAKGLYLSLA